MIKYPVVNLDLIKELRSNKNISIEEMSTTMGYKGYQGYYYKENGSRKMSAEDIAKISTILSVPINKLFFDN
ncbi:XRE family transcriptional regulator [Lysinibacillus pakistanensis]|uniref:XRE family transcriptional regulator n=1 Tax=Lysinibacillus pakistanensis TaxID=759811 RepID=A0ABX6DD60_9BACI|nr:XRE family transcriptional regulator [Lysinibacillus pakistanensis]